MEFDVDQVRAMTAEDRAPYDAQVESRIIRFKDLEADWRLSPNCQLPQYQRANFVYIGVDWSGRVPPIERGDNFSCGIILAPPGKGAALHAHTTEEMFMALSGRWSVFWGQDDAQEIELEQWDAVSIPPPVMRGFRNIGDEDAHLMFILGGGAPPPPVPHPQVVRELEEVGESRS